MFMSMLLLLFFNFSFLFRISTSSWSSEQRPLQVPATTALPRIPFKFSKQLIAPTRAEINVASKTFSTITSIASQATPDYSSECESTSTISMDGLSLSDAVVSLSASSMLHCMPSLEPFDDDATTNTNTTSSSSSTSITSTTSSSTSTTTSTMSNVTIMN